MMFETQQIIVLAIVAFAAAYVVAVMVWRLRKRASKACGGGGCDGCSGSAETLGEQKAFVDIGQLHTIPTRDRVQ